MSGIGVAEVLHVNCVSCPARINARSTACCSSRTFPGHCDCRRNAIEEAESLFGGTPASRHKSARNFSASGPISSVAHAAAGVRSETRRFGSTDPAETVFVSHGSADSRSWRKPRAHPLERRPSFPAVALPRPAEIAAASLASSTADRRSHPETACRHARCGCARRATVPRR